MPERNARLLVGEVGQNRGPNTVKLRSEYSKYVSDRQTDGLDFLPFEDWAKERFPNLKILNQPK